MAIYSCARGRPPTGVVLLGRLAPGRGRVAKAEDPLVLHAQDTASYAGIELVVVAAEQVERGEVLDDVLHDLGGRLWGANAISCTGGGGQSTPFRTAHIATLNFSTSSMRAVLPSLTHVWKKLGAADTPNASPVIPVSARLALLAITRNVPKSKTSSCCVCGGREEISLKEHRRDRSIRHHLLLLGLHHCLRAKRLLFNHTIGLPISGESCGLFSSLLTKMIRKGRT